MSIADCPASSAAVNVLSAPSVALIDACAVWASENFVSAVLFAVLAVVSDSVAVATSVSRFSCVLFSRSTTS